MRLIALGLTALVAAEHIWFLVLEMFLWEKPLGLKTFGLTKEAAAITAPLAKNQGLYNGFLAAGLIWSLTGGHFGWHLGIFFLTCVIIAGVFGAITVNRKIFFVQGLPALLALIALHF